MRQRCVGQNLSDCFPFFTAKPRVEYLIFGLLYDMSGHFMYSRASLQISKNVLP